RALRRTSSNISARKRTSGRRSCATPRSRSNKVRDARRHAMTDSILAARDGDIATITLNRPERLNALNRGMWQALGDTLRQLSADDTLRCIVLRGAGGKAFAAGADIAEFAVERADARQAKAYGELIHATMQAVAQCRHPTVALIEGA